MNEKNKVYITIKRTQDGECEIQEYTGSKKVLGGTLFVTFTETDDEGEKYSHLLKISDSGMEWIKKGQVSTNTGFRKGEVKPFLFATPHGDIRLTIKTHEYIFTSGESQDGAQCTPSTEKKTTLSVSEEKEKDTHYVCVSYSVCQGESPVSDYETELIIRPL